MTIIRLDNDKSQGIPAIHKITLTCLPNTGIMHEKNKELSAIFHNMAAIYRYRGDDRFRALAYEKASKAIASLPEDIKAYLSKDSLKDIPGIGEHTEEKINEYLATGKIAKYEELKKQVPLDIMDMMDITGFGPQSLKKIHDELHIKTRKNLIEVLQNGDIANLKGFGTKKVDNMMRGLKLHKALEDRMLLWDALEAGEQVLEELKKLPGVTHAELAGSLRRKKETIAILIFLLPTKINRGRR